LSETPLSEAASEALRRPANGADDDGPRNPRKRSWLHGVRPTAGEVETLQFLLPLGGLGIRMAVSAALFLAGLALWFLSSGFHLSAAGLVLLLLGHLPLWVRSMTNAPGGATPEHEEVWVPTDEDWFENIDRLERRAAKWDTTPWDLSNALGCLILFAALALLGIALLAVAQWLGVETAWRLGIAAVALLVPLWLNGLRSTWQPSELRLKGEALEQARKVALDRGVERDFELVPMLALREGEKGKYPVDARLMLRPKSSDEPEDTGFLGVQLQVALNNVQGKDYPYLYAVVLGKEDKDFRLPDQVKRHRGPRHKVPFVFERGKGQGARFLVIRQYADNSGGWHTEPEHIREIVEVALEEGRRAWKENRRPQT